MELKEFTKKELEGKLVIDRGEFLGHVYAIASMRLRYDSGEISYDEFKKWCDERAKEHENVVVIF